MFNLEEVEHLARDDFDHTLLFVRCENTAVRFQKPFKFLKYCIEHVNFKKVVRRNWDAESTDNPFMIFKRKIKKVKKDLSEWSRQTFGDIFQQLIIREEIAKLKEKLFKEFPS